MYIAIHKRSKSKAVSTSRKPPKSFSDIELGRILQLHDDKKTYVDIAKQFKVHNYTISRIIKRFKEVGVSDQRIFNGRKRKTDRRTDSRIGREVIKDRFITAASIKKNLNLDSVSLSTIYRRIHESVGCRSFWAAKKPFVSEVNRKKRLLWAKEHRNWTLEQWSQVFWTDESPFVLQYNGRKRVWRL